MQNQNKDSRRAERDKNYLDAIEQVFQFKLSGWQKEQLLEIRRLSLAGKPIEVESYRRK